MTRKITATAPNGQVLSRKTDRDYAYMIAVRTNKADVVRQMRTRAASLRETARDYYNTDVHVTVDPTWHNVLVQADWMVGTTRILNVNVYSLTNGAKYDTAGDIPDDVVAMLQMKGREAADKQSKQAAAKAKREDKAADQAEAVEGDDYYQVGSWHGRYDLAAKALTDYLARGLDARILEVDA